MADKKVSDLPSLNGADVDPADLLYIVDSSAGAAGSKKITVGQYQLAPVSGGTANTVVYLNGSKVESSSSALTFDGTNLGVGTSSPAQRLDVTGAVNSVQARFGNVAGRGLEIGTSIISGTNDAGSVLNAKGATSGTMIFQTDSTERMRLDSSGNLGLGVTPSAWAGGGKAIQVNARASLFGFSDDVNTGLNTYYDGSIFRYIQTGFASLAVQTAGQHRFFTAPSGTAGNAISFTQAMTLDADGDLGIGSTSPSYPLHINKSFSLYGAYLNNTSTSTGDYSSFVATGASSGMPFMMLGAGGTTVGNAGIQGAGYVGTQNNTPLVFVTNDAARARITSGGDLLVGTTSALTGFTQARLTISGTTGFVAQTTAATNEAGAFWNAATAGDNVFVLFGTETTHTLRGTITYNRAGGLTAYNTTSDYRAKDIIGPVQNPGATIDALKVYEGVMKGATQSRPMLIAHEAQEHAPYAVSGVKDEVNEDGTPKFQQMDVSSLVPLLLAEIQSLRARVAALEAK